MLLVVMAVLAAGCNTDPSTNVHQPMTVRPEAPAQKVQRDGSIYQASASRPLFEDRRARFVGDTLTVNIVEKTSASKSTSESFERTGEVDVSVPTPTILGQTAKPLPFAIPGFSRGANLDTSVTADSSSSFENKDSGSNSNAFSGSITVTVIEVLANGNLLVSGEKQVAINEKTEFVRLSGVVNPINITAANAVSSTQLADARIESKGKQSMDTAQIVSLLSRFFLTLVPF
jgi:flagellar L-ring protein precursor FlgH